MTQGESMSAAVLAVLACPRCRGPLAVMAAADAERVARGEGAGWEGAMSCAPCGVAYPIVSGIPVLLSERAVVIGG